MERESEFGALSSYWTEASTGRGRLVFLGGEGGAGKTSVSFEFARLLGRRARFLVGFCDQGSTPRALGPLFDVAEALGILAELDASKVQRTSLFASVRAALGRAPTLLLLEDVHWADEATLDLIRYLGQRLRGLPLLMIATFRDDEVAGTHPLSATMGDLATAAAVTRMQLPLLTTDAVAELARILDRDIDVVALHRSTSGNPFFVTEVLAGDAAELPTTVRDAVLARIGRLPVPARRVVESAAVVGLTAEIQLVLDVSGQLPDAVDAAVQGGILRDRGTDVAFRHELARQAVLMSLPPAARAGLHRQVLAWLLAAGSQDHRRLSVHAAACGDAPTVVVHAPRAAEHAACLGSHREAAEHLRIARRFCDALPAVERADLLERLSYECYLTSELSEAVDARQAAIALREAAGDPRRVGIGKRWLSRFVWYLGQNAEAQQLAVAAVEQLQPLGPSADLAMAYSNRSQLLMTGGTTDEALVWGRRALEEAVAAGDREVEAHALNNIGSALLLSGDLVEGRSRLERSLAIALADGLDEHAVRAWINLGTIYASKRMLGDAETTLRLGIAYCAERDLISWSLYLQARLAQVRIEQGDITEADQLAGAILRRPHGSAVSRVPALLTTATIAVRQGRPETADNLLVELQDLARRTAEPQRMVLVALLAAEAAWTAGRIAEIVPLTDEAWAAYGSWEPWILAELAWWRHLGGATEVIPFELPPPFALMRDGHQREASAAWTTVGRPFWSALALANGSPAEAAEAVAGLLRLEATASAQAVRRDRASRGLSVPRGPRKAAQSNPAGLTARELDILGYLVEGLSDAEIAAQLTLSERTIGHHVSAVLRKLGVPSRSRAAAAANSILGSREAAMPSTPTPELRMSTGRRQRG